MKSILILFILCGAVPGGYAADYSVQGNEVIRTEKVSTEELGKRMIEIQRDLISLSEEVGRLNASLSSLESQLERYRSVISSHTGKINELNREKGQIEAILR